MLIWGGKCHFVSHTCAITNVNITETPVLLYVCRSFHLDVNTCTQASKHLQIYTPGSIACLPITCMPNRDQIQI